MKTYWDHTEQERSQLTEDEIKSMLDVALMTEGVKKPIAPTLKEVPKSPLGERKRVFGIEAKSKYGSEQSVGIVFPTLEAAQAFIDLNPMKDDYDYEVGSEFRYFVPLQDAKITTTDLYAMDQINEFRSSLKHRKALSEENQRLSSEFAKASSLSEKITDGIWADYYKCKAKHDTLRGIIATFDDYVKLTSGDKSLALEFLKKVTTGEEIEEVNQWFPGSIEG